MEPGIPCHFAHCRFGYTLGREWGGDIRILTRWKKNKAPEVAWRRAPTVRITPSIDPQVSPHLTEPSKPISCRRRTRKKKRIQSQGLEHHRIRARQGRMSWEEEDSRGSSIGDFPTPLPLSVSSLLSSTPGIPRVPQHLHFSSPPPVSSSSSRFPALWRGRFVSRRESTALGNMICEELDRGILPSIPTGP